MARELNGGMEFLAEQLETFASARENALEGGPTSQATPDAGRILKPRRSKFVHEASHGRYSVTRNRYDNPKGPLETHTLTYHPKGRGRLATQDIGDFKTREGAVIVAKSHARHHAWGDE
jgi:hypothetical protein